MDSTRLPNADAASVGPIPPRLVTAAELADYLGVAPNTVRRWARTSHEGFPRPLNFGPDSTRWGTRRYDLAEVVEWARQRREAEKERES